MVIILLSNVQFSLLPVNSSTCLRDYVQNDLYRQLGKH